MDSYLAEDRWAVYRHTSPSNKVYIGITKQNVKTRWEYGYGYISCVLFYKAIKKYGWNNIKHEILFSGLSEDKAKELEINLIRHYKALGISYNITDGGDGTVGRKKTDREKELLRKAHLGIKLSEETKRKMSESRKGKPGTMLGKKHSEETKIKMSEAKKGTNNPIYGRIRSEEEKQKYREAQKTRRRVAKINPDSDIIEGIYDSINLAGKENNCSRAHIGDCCHGKIKLFKGYKWKFIDG